MQLIIEEIQDTTTEAKTVVHIPIEFVDIADSAWRQWREIEYLTKAKMRKRIEGFTHNEFTDTKLCIDLETKAGSIFSEAYNERIEFVMEAEDWFVPNEIVQTYIDGKEYKEPYEQVTTNERYYQDFIHNFKVYAMDKKQAYASICKECVRRDLQIPKFWQVEVVSN